MVLDNRAIPRVVATLEPEAFYDETNRAVYEATVKAFEGKAAVDLVVLRDAVGPGFVGGVERLAAYVEGCPSAANWKAYLSVVEDRWRLREAYTKADEIKTIAKDGGSLEKVWGLADEIKSVKRTADQGVRFGDSIKNCAGNLAEMRETGVDLFTGWGNVDGCIGGIRRKLLYILGAKTSNGKTSVSLNIAVKALKDNKKARVLVNGFENVDQIPVRMASILSGVPLDHYLKPDQCSDEQYVLMQESLELLEEFKDRVIIMNGASVAQMRAMCDEFKPDIVLLDYIQRYAHKYSLGSEDRLSHAIGKLVSDLQDIAIEKNCAVFGMSQLARRQEETRNRKPVISDLKESGDTENYADCIFLLWWPWRDNPNGKNPEEFYVIVAKNKLGPCEDFLLRLNVKTLKVTEWGAKDDPIVHKAGNADRQDPAPVDGAIPEWYRRAAVDHDNKRPPPVAADRGNV